jgi:pimeloyl-ACP methyl ester carboxylesterase
MAASMRANARASIRPMNGFRARLAVEVHGTMENRKRGMHNSESAGEKFQLVVRGHSLEVGRIPARTSNLPELVFLHEGLGSVSHWKDFPGRVAVESGCAVTIYSRYGSGNSDVLKKDRTARYMHDEALLALPELLSKLEITHPVLVGHSDGGSIALIYVGAHKHATGVILLAPHVFVEDLSVASIAEAKVKFQTTNLREKLTRHHRDVDSTFWGWNNIWLNPDFRRWNIEEYLPRITCPILCIQGKEDQYGTMEQVEAIARQSGGPVEILALADCHHSPQRDQPDATAAAIGRFVKELVDRGHGEKIRQVPS